MTKKKLALVDICSKMGCRIIGCGGYLPALVVSNKDLEKSVETTSEWIHSRTGILQRHIAAPNKNASDLALKAAEAAILDANINLNNIDLIIVATTTPDNSFPSTASKLQHALGLRGVPAFDIQAVCAGFVYGLHIAHGLMLAHKYKTILLVAAEKMSSLLDWQDRSTCILFGDGAGAVILQQDDSNFGIIDSKIHCEGAKFDILYTDGGLSSTGSLGKIKMKGQEVFRQAIAKMSSSVEEILAANQLTIADINYLIPHQANIRIINAIADKLNINQDKIVKTIELHANCSAASIPLALDVLKKSRKINDGEIIVLTAFGAGTTWGSIILKW